mmetsp:Transcript_80167/g.223245  ORF Transcript_80167/g.223245 Transcript_80167/m.223245 type:complete len:392 (+) Transcript_80167:2337-3512(+)
MPGLPLPKRRKIALSNHKGPKASFRELGDAGLYLCHAGRFRREPEHDVVGPLGQQDFLASYFHDDGHALPCGCELVDCQDFEAQLFHASPLSSLGVYHVAASPGKGHPELFRGRYQSLLVRALGLELALHVDVYGVRQAQDVAEVFQQLGILRVLDDFVGPDEALSIADFTINLLPDEDLLKLHYVFGERAGLVGKHVRNLPEFITQVRCPRCGFEPIFVGHVWVGIYGLRVKIIAHLHGRVQRDRHQVRVEHKECYPKRDGGRQLAQWFLVAVGVQVPIAVPFELFDGDQAKIDNNGHKRLRGNRNPHRLVDHHLKIRELYRHRAGVHHDPRVLARVNHDAPAPLCIPQHCAPEEQVLGTQWFFRRSAADSHGPGETIDRLLRWLRRDES